MSKKNNKNSSANQAAQYLDNLVGRNVSGFEPERTSQTIIEDQKAQQILAELLSGKRKVEAIDIEKSFMDRPVNLSRVYIPFIVIAFIIREDDARRARLLGKIDPDVFDNKFARFLFLQIKKLHQENQFSIENVQNSIDNCGKEVFCYELSPTLRLSLFHRWFQTLATYPTAQQYDIALSKLSENKTQHTG